MGIKVETLSEITLHVHQNKPFGQLGDGYLAIPDDSLGTEYYVLTYCPFGGFCQFAVTATEDDTQIRVVFPGNVSTDAVCVDGITLPSNASNSTTFPYNMNEFDVLHFESDQDLTGTYIISDRPVGVIVGARDVGATQGYLMEQIPPVNRLGTQFVVPTNEYNNAGDIVKILASVDDTLVYIQGFSSFVISKRGEYIEKRIDWRMRSLIKTSKPVLVVQIMSVDIYNHPSDVTGTPSLVLVPHVHQWNDGVSYFLCFASSLNDTLLALVTETVGAYSIPIFPPPTSYLSIWTVVEGTSYSVLLLQPDTVKTTMYGQRRGGYGFCNGSSSVLIDADWSWTYQVDFCKAGYPGCTSTVPSPGDGVDNDCDGHNDEDNCTMEDLEVQFSSNQNEEGNITYKSVNVRGAGFVNFTVTSCDVARIEFTDLAQPESSLIIKISIASLDIDRCSWICVPVLSATLAEINCSLAQSFSFQWRENGSYVNKFQTPTEEFTWYTSAWDVDYAAMRLSAITGSANFTIGLAEKDCGKVYFEGDGDNLGNEFILPVYNTDRNYLVLVSTPDTSPGGVHITLDVSNNLAAGSLDASKTLIIHKYDINETIYKGVRLRALGGEVSVYLMRSTTATYGMQILPTDILGPVYQLYKGDNNSSNQTVCEVFAVDREANTNNGVVGLVTHMKISVNNLNDLGSQHRLESDRPLAVFCSPRSPSRGQLPPKETLGRIFFIPKLDYTALNASATVWVVATEDSTVVTIRGDYDHVDTMNLTGEVLTRVLESNVTYRLESTKPVQVQLEINSSQHIWNSVVTIPPTNQYKTDHVFPALPANFSVFESSVVNTTGESLQSLISPGQIFDNPVTYSYPSGATFSLTAVRNSTTNVPIFFIIPGDAFYKDTNKPCKLSSGVPGDGVDNDCDGLIDEEQCSETVAPGTVDWDIDGSVNEDCAPATSAAPQTLQMSIPDTMITCVNVAVQNVTEGIVVTADQLKITFIPTRNYPILPISPEPPEFEPLSMTGSPLILPTTAPDPGSTAAPEENCHTACLCPCGWVKVPQNYTVEQLKEKVAQIQEALKVKKEELSATMRSKTSAQDERMSAQAIGYAGLAFLVITLGCIVLLDVSTIAREMKTLVANVKSRWSQ